MGIFKDRPNPAVTKMHALDNKQKPLSDTDKACYVVGQWILQNTETTELEADDVYIISFQLSYRDWVALVGTTMDDGRIYQVSFSNEKNGVEVTVFQEVASVYNTKRDWGL